MPQVGAAVRLENSLAGLQRMAGHHLRSSSMSRTPLEASGAHYFLNFYLTFEYKAVLIEVFIGFLRGL